MFSPNEIAKMKIRQWRGQIEGLNKLKDQGKLTDAEHASLVKMYQTKINAVQEVFTAINEQS
jgi:hypothetical protein